MNGLAFLASFVAGLSGGWAVTTSVFVVRERRRRRAGKHEHIYGPWEDCEIEAWRGGKLRNVAGQKRDCLSCGARAVREVR